MKRVSNSFILSTVSESEVLSAGLSLANKRSCGYDDLSPLMLKRILPALLTPLTHVYNTTFLTGIVPKQFKIAKVVPVFKSGDPSLPVNYRPISLLSSFSKILEKLMYNKMILFINKYDILSNCQFGFRANYGTEDVLHHLSHYVSGNMDSGVDTIGLFIDVSKAFDSLTHTILLDKLHAYGFRGLAHAWITSYLTDRFQYISNGGCMSSLKLLTTGVPQGSILGPLLFLLYVNDLPNISDMVKTLLYADDTTCLIPCPRDVSVQPIVDGFCVPLFNWFNVNCLTLNLKKCNFIFLLLVMLMLSVFLQCVLTTMTLSGCYLLSFWVVL